MNLPQEQQPPLQQQPQQHPLANYQFSSEELRVLRECNSESFFQRSLPLGTALGVGSYWAVKQGYLKGNGQYGAVPKIVLGVIVGYFTGKFSYQNKCSEKLMKLPNSRLAEVLRQRRINNQGGVMSQFTPDPNLGTALSFAPFSNATDIYSDERPKERSTSLNLDFDNPHQVTELDDIYRPSLDSPSIGNEQELPIEPKTPGISYDELRRRNREEYEKKHQKSTVRLLPPDGDNAVLRGEPTREYRTNAPQNPPAKQNKYGDSWTD